MNALMRDAGEMEPVWILAMPDSPERRAHLKTNQLSPCGLKHYRTGNGEGAAVERLYSSPRIPAKGGSYAG